MLATIEHDPGIPASLRARAHELNMGYPSAPALHEWLATGRSGLPEDWAACIGNAYKLFADVQWPVVGSEDTRRELIATLRHFPDPWTIGTFASPTSAAAVKRLLSLAGLCSMAGLGHFANTGGTEDHCRYCRDGHCLLRVKLKE